jgi:signal peptide peptidase SppA
MTITIPRLAELAAQPWFLRAETIDAWQRIMSAKVEGGKVEVTDYVASVSSRNEDREWEQDGSLAIIPVTGSLQKRSRFFNSGMTYAKLRAMVNEALEDPGIEAVLLDIDSPGGTADGLTGLSDFLAEAARQKPLYAFADGQACSAAYWIACLAKEIAAPPEGYLGSIGVRTLHIDYSESARQRGVRVTHLAMGEFKTAGNSDEPLSEPARAYIMGHLEGLYNLFVDAVALNRGLDPQTVRDTQARVYLASEAEQLGLIDLVMSREQFINHIKENLSMDLKELQEKHPALVAQIQSEAQAGLISKDEAKKEQAQAVSAEGERCVALVGAIMGEELGEKLKGVMDSGATAEQAKALAGLLAKPTGKEDAPENEEKELMQDLLSAYQEGDQGLSPAPKNTSQQEAKAQGKEFPTLVSEYKAEHGCNLAQAQQAVAKAHPEAHKAYIKSFNKEA